MSDAMDTYAAKTNNTNWKKVEDIAKFGVWSPILEAVDTNFVYTKDVEVDDPGGEAGGENPDGKVGKKQLKEVGYQMLLCCMDPIENGSFHPYNKWTNLAVSNWLKVKESGLPGGGWGLFADRHFEKDQILTVYYGKVVNPNKKRKSNYRLGHKGKVIAPDTNNSNVPLLWGGHIANDIFWTPVELEGKHDVRANKLNNAKFEGTLLISTRIIRVRQEITVGYNLTLD